jgi:hypothetical protein
MALLVVGCSSGPPGIALPEIDADEAARQAMKEYDSNGDGAIAGEEFDKCPPLKNSLEAFDANGDKGVTAAEIADRLRSYREGNTAIIGVGCWVTLDGKPLPGAKVRLIPEKFVGPNIKPASGTSDDQGFVRLVTEGMSDDISGIHYGLFRIEVSLIGSDGQEQLPARYNSQSILGQETSINNLGRGGGILLALSSSQ